MATVEAAAPPVIEETTAQRILRFVARAPVHVFLVVLGVMWLVPTLGLFFTSLLSPEEFTEEGWWTILTEPAKVTFENYELVFDTEAIT